MLETKNINRSLSKTISNYSIFDGVDMSDINNLAMEGTLLYYKKGQEILREGEYLPAFYLILKGMVKVCKISSSGREFTIDWRYAGEGLGWGQVIRGGFFNATYTTLDDTTIVAFKKEKFFRFLSRNPIVTAKISNQSIDLINKLFNKLIDVAADTAGNRLVRTLKSLYEETGSTLNLTHQEIAQMAWTTLETTTRILSKLKKDNIISTKRGRIIILKPEILLEEVKPDKKYLSN